MASTEARVAAFRQASRVAAAVATSIGVAALLGWIFEVPALRSAFAAGITLKTNGALALIAAGTATLLMAGPAPGARRVRASRGLAWVVLGIGALTLAQHLFRIDLGIDQLLFMEAPGEAGTAAPNRMGVPASLCFTLAGLALLLLDRRTPHRREPHQGLALAIGVIALFPLVGFAYGADAMFGIAGYTGISLNMALALVALAVALLFLRPERGLVRLVCSDDAGGVVSRSLLVPALVLPFVLGWVAVIGQGLGLFEWRFGTALMAVGFIIWFTSLVVWNAGLLSRVATARVRAEAGQRDLGRQLGNVLQGISQGFIALGPDGRCTYMNRRGEQLLGLEGRAPVGLTLAELFPGPADAPLHEAAKRALADGRTIGIEAEFAALRTWFEIDLVPTERGLTLFVQDITERLRRDEERRELLESERAARAEAQRANRLKDEFLATVSHELRTPLNAILGWSQLLVRGTGEPEHQRRGLAAIERNARLQAQMIEDLLDVSRIISGKLRLDVGQVDLMPVVDAALDTARPAAEAKRITILREFDLRAPIVRGDPSRLQQVVWNLLSNAVKFTPEGGEIRVRLSVTGPSAEIAVTDSGLGIRPDVLAQIFGRFWQADASSTRQHGGLGLGLAIVRHLVELHGGTVSAQSEGEGRGSTFTVELPLATNETDGLKDVAPWDDAEDLEPPDLAGLEVLVVDDEPDSRELVRRILEERGARVREADSAVAALNMLAERRPDILVSDIGMPGTDGYELIRQVRMDEPNAQGHVPAIALTAFARPEDRRRAFLSGFEIHLVKPVAPAELTAVVASLTGRTRTSKNM